MSSCPGCGRQDSLGKQFCTACGTILAAGVPGGQDEPQPLILRPPNRSTAQAVAPTLAPPDLALQQTMLASQPGAPLIPDRWPSSTPQPLIPEPRAVDSIEPAPTAPRRPSRLIIGLAAVGALGLATLAAVGIVAAQSDSGTVSVTPVATSQPTPSSVTYSPSTGYTGGSDYSGSTDYSTPSASPTSDPYDSYDSPSPYPTYSTPSYTTPSYSDAPTGGGALSLHYGGGDLNVRTSPSTSSSSVAIIPDGGTFTYSCYTTGDYVSGSVTSSDVWLYVALGGGGYVSAAFAEVDSDHEFGPHC